MENLISLRSLFFVIIQVAVNCFIISLLLKHKYDPLHIAILSSFLCTIINSISQEIEKKN